MTEEARTKETRIRLSEVDHERLRIAAAHAGISMAEFVKRATMKQVEENEQGRKNAV